jgi:hypothetical protein
MILSIPGQLDRLTSPVGFKPPAGNWRLYLLLLYLEGGFALFLESGSFYFFKKKRDGKNSQFLPYIYIYILYRLKFFLVSY